MTCFLRHFCALLFALCLVFCPLFALAQERITVGAACTTGRNAADWDTMMQCVNGVWKRGPLFLGAAKDSAGAALTCSASTKGVLQLYNNVPVGCNGTNWVSLIDGTTYSGNDAYTKLLLHFENNVTDSSVGANTVTNNNVTFSGGTYKIGSYSAIFNGSNGYLLIPYSSAIDISSGDFTIDSWVYITSLADYFSFFSSANDTSNTGIFFGYAPTGGYKYRFGIYSGGTQLVGLNSNMDPPTNQWVHVAVVRSGNNYTLYLNGTSVATATSATGPIMPGTGTVIGRDYVGSGGYYLHGYMDEFRISKGVARWTSNFTPPTSPYN